MSAIHYTETSGMKLLNNLTQVGDYIIDGKLGEGRFGVVYKGSHTLTAEQVAIKFLKVWSVPDHARNNLIKRFELEYETGKIDSEYLIHSFEISELEGIPYFVMEFCSGGNLERKINTGINENEGRRIAAGILKGLNDLHRNGKIHRDLKPENVLFDSNNRPKLTDFGISGHINIQLTVVNQDDRPEQIFGSYAYMAPEQLSPRKRKNTLLPTIDIFSFGVVCYELFHKKLPFGRWEFQNDIDPYIRRAALGQYDEIKPDLNPEWKRIIDGCLTPDREERFQNTDEIFNELNQEHKEIKDPIDRNFTLQVLDGEEYGRFYKLTLSSLLTLGRDTEYTINDIPLVENITNYISRSHATFEWIDDSAYLRDGQWNQELKLWKLSKNGTFINGKPVDGFEGYKLFKNDVITIGNTSLKIF